MLAPVGNGKDDHLYICSSSVPPCPFPLLPSAPAWPAFDAFGVSWARNGDNAIRYDERAHFEDVSTNTLELYKWVHGTPLDMSIDVAQAFG